jgi:protein involved in polysaccharide export with SLBB domain
MPMTRFLAAAPTSSRKSAALVASCTLALAICGWPSIAQAQYTGNSSNDLTTQGSTDLTRASNGSVDAGSNVVNGTGASNGTSNGTNSATPRTGQARSGNAREGQPESRLTSTRPFYKPSEFERYVQQLPEAQNVRRFGENLVTDDATASATQDALPLVPGDYIVRPGDEIALTIWGTLDADLLLTVDRAGRIAVPHVGAISVAGLHSVDLADAVSRRVGQTYKNFQLTATLGQVRAIRVFVSGFVQRPGTVTVSGLSSVLHAIMRAGGPSAAGSFRDIHLRRAGKEEAIFDLYDLLLKGNRDTDRLVQPDDVIFVGPVGTQVAVLGSVNQQGIYELKGGETLSDALRMAGSFTAVADRGRVSIERLADRLTGRVEQLNLPEHQADVVGTGDVLRVFSQVSATLPKQYQRQHVRIEGEVVNPGDYILAPGSRVADLLRAAGGLTSTAYPYGTELTRESVRKTQEVNYERALSDLETDMSRNQSSQRVTSAEELASLNASASANTRLIERLRQLKPTGRVVLQLPPDAATLPNMALEDGDTISIPIRGTSVGIFGSVFNTGSFVFEAGHTTAEYLAQAGGPTQGADKNSIFMVHANGSVVSARQGQSFWHTGHDFNDVIVQPGDTLFVPEQINKSTFVQDAKDWTQILYQFGLGLAGLNALGL